MDRPENNFFFLQPNEADKGSSADWVHLKTSVDWIHQRDQLWLDPLIGTHGCLEFS